MIKKKQNPFLKGGTVATLCFGLVLCAFVASGCNKLHDSLIDDTSTQIIHNNISTWECIPEQGIIITLTIDSAKDEVHVSTDPQDINHTQFPQNYTESSMTYMLWDNTQFIMIGDTLYYANSESRDLGFVRTILSSDSMKLEYFGVRIAIDNLVTDYLFTLKKN